MKTCRVARKSNGLPEGFPYTSSQGITPLSVLFSFLLLLQAVPFSAADDDGYRGFDDLEVRRAFIIIGVFYFVSVFLCCLFAYYQGCLFSGSAPFSASQQGRRREGLYRSEIESLPTFGFVEVKNLNIGERAPECAVCLAEFTDEATLRLLPKCHHAFHSHCIDGWLTGHSTCPVCRCVLLPVVCGVELTAPPSRSNGDSGGSDRSGDLEANAAENWDRFRLRLPEVMRKKILVEPRSSRPESSNGSDREEGVAAREGVAASQGSCCGGLAGLLMAAGEAAATAQDLHYLGFQVV